MDNSIYFFSHNIFFEPFPGISDKRDFGPPHPGFGVIESYVFTHLRSMGAAPESSRPIAIAPKPGGWWDRNPCF